MDLQTSKGTLPSSLFVPLMNNTTKTRFGVGNRIYFILTVAMNSNEGCNKHIQYGIYLCYRIIKARDLCSLKNFLRRRLFNFRTIFNQFGKLFVKLAMEFFN